MKIKLFLAAFFVGCLMSGASFGRCFTQSEIDQIRPGYTTGQDLVHLFGQPTTWTTDFRQTTSLEWFCSPGPGLQTYIPFVGSFMGGFDVSIQDLVVDVGPDGRVRRFNINGQRVRTQRTVGYSK